jgi:hypothetical protein
VHCGWKCVRVGSDNVYENIRTWYGQFLMSHCHVESSNEGSDNCGDNSSGIDIIWIKVGHKNMLGNVHIMSLCWCIQFLLFHSIKNLKTREKICGA